MLFFIVGLGAASAQTTVAPGGTLQVGTASLPVTLTGTDGTPGNDGERAVIAGEAATVNVGALGTITGGDGGPGPVDGQPAGNGGDAVAFLSSGVLTNNGTITGGMGGLAVSANGGNGGLGVYFGGNGILTNHGDILGGSGGLSNTLSGTGADAVRINGVGTILNTGNIIAGVGGTAPDSAHGAGGSGVVLMGGGSVINQGTIRGQRGPVVQGASALVFTGGAGVYLGGDGSVNNSSDIFAGDGGLTQFSANPVQGGVGVHIAGDGTVQNSGTIRGGASGLSVDTPGVGGAGVRIEGVGTMTNAGTIAGGSGNFNIPVLQIPPDLVPHGGSGGNAIEMVGGGAFTNTGVVQGGVGGAGMLSQGSGGAAVVLGSDGTVTNHGSLLGGSGGPSLLPVVPSGGMGGVALKINGVGTVINTGTNARIIGGTAGGGFGAGGHGVELTGGGSVTNGGLIQGGNGNRSFTGPETGGSGVLLGDDGTVINSGQILGGYQAAALRINGVGDVTNNVGGLIRGGDSPVMANEIPVGDPAGAAVYLVGGGTLLNRGDIQGGTSSPTFLSDDIGGEGVRFDAGGTIVNEGTIRGGVGADGGVVNGLASGGGFGGAGVRVSGLADITNTGTIEAGTGGEGIFGGAGGTGVMLSGGGILNNEGTIRAGSSGDGQFLAYPAGHGVHLSAGGTITNSGDIIGGDGGSVLVADAGGTGADGGHGVLVEGGGTLTNSGNISGGAAGTGATATGVAGNGVLFSGAAGTLTNEGTGVIQGGVVMGDYANAVTLFTGSRISGGLDMSSNTGTTLTLDGTGTETLSTAVTGTLVFEGTLIKQGSGRWNLTTSSTRTSATQVNAGTLAVGHDTALGSGTITLADLTTLTAATAGDRVLDNDLVINGTVTMGTAAGANMTFNGNIDLNGGNRTLLNPGSAGDTDGVVDLNGEISDGGLTFGAVGGAVGSRAYFNIGGAASNSYTGDTVVGAFTSVRFQKIGGATAVAGNLQIHGTGEAMVAFDEQIADTATVVIDESGMLTLGDTSDVIETIVRLEGGGSVSLSSITTGSTLRVREGDFAGAVHLGVAGGTSLEKYGSGVLELTGASTYLGNTVVSGGRLIVNNTTGSATGAGTVFVQGGALLGGAGFIDGTVVVESGGTLSAGNSPGTLTVGGLDLKGGSNLEFELGTVSDLIDINGLLNQSVDGTISLNLSDGPGFAPGTYTLLSFDSLDPSVTLGDFESNTFAYLGLRLELLPSELLLTIFGLPYGPFIQNSAFVFTPVDADFLVSGYVQTGTPSENNTVNSLTFAPGSFLQVYNRLAITSGNFTVNSGRATIAGGTVFVPGAFTKLGAGALFTNGNFQVAGNSYIRQGALHVNGAFQTPSFSVLPGGFLGGNGLIIGNVFNSGTVGPGNSVGELTIRGDYTQTQRGTLQIEIASPRSFDRLVVSGTARFAGTLDVRTLGGSKLMYGQQYPFLQARKIVGKFDRILMPQPSVNRGRFYITGHHGVLLVAPTSYTLVAQTPNQTRLARALDKWIGSERGDIGEVTLALDLLSEEQYPQAFEAVMPQVYAGAVSTAVELSVNQGQQLHQYLSARRLGARAQAGSEGAGLGQRAASGGKSMKDAKNVVPPQVSHGDDYRWQAWMQGSGLFSDGGLSLTPNEDFESGTFVVGADYAITESFALGFFASYQEGWGDYASDVSTDLESVRFGLYATYDQEGFYANAAVGGGTTDFDTRRPIQWATLNRTARSDPDAAEFFTMLGGGYDFQAGNFTFGPQASIQYTRLRLDGFTERGADSLNLRMDDFTEESLRAYLGARIAYDIRLSERVVIIPELRAFWQHEFLQDGAAMRSRLAGGEGPGFDYVTDTRNRDSVFAGAGIGLQIGAKFYANVYYNAEFGREDDVNHTMSVGATMKF